MSLSGDEPVPSPRQLSECYFGVLLCPTGFSKERKEIMAPVHADLARVMCTEVLTKPDAVDTLSTEWNALLDQSDKHSYFLRAEWNSLWWNYHAPAGARLYLITCRDERGHLVGLAPLYWRQHRMLGIPYVRELLFLGMGIELKTSEYMDLIARPGQEQAVAAAIAACLHRRSDWDRVWLWQVPSDSIVLPHYVRMLRARTETAPCDRAPYVDTATDWNSYKAGLGRSMRRNVEYYPRRLFKRYACEFVCVRSNAELEVSINALIELHQMRWRSEGKPGAFSDPAFAAFLRDAARESLSLGRLRLWTLKIDGNIEAALIGFVDNGVLHYFQKGFNPAYRKDDLGTAMLALCIRACFEEPEIRAFDFMGGGAAYKDMWTRRSRATLACQANRFNARALLFSLRGQLWNLAADVFRTIAPPRLRLARAERLRRRSQVYPYVD